MGFIDVDSHIVECDETWDYLDPAESHHRPIKLAVTKGEDKNPVKFVSAVGTSYPALYGIGDGWGGIFPADGLIRQNGNRYDNGTLNLRDPARRIADLDFLGIDVQMLQSTLFIGAQAQNPMAEAAIKRSWNRWMAERVADSGGRLVWAAEVPTRVMERAIQEVEFAAAHGAKGVHLSGVENHCYLDDPYFTPLFARMQDLDLSVVAHVGRPVTQSQVIFPIGSQFPSMASFVEHVGSPWTVFWTAWVTDLNVRFPRLRICINETGATWTHSLLHHWQRILASMGDFKVQKTDPAQLEEKNIFIASWADEDIASLTALLGENVMTIGTDYGHNDHASQLTGHTAMLDRTDITHEVATKIVDTNGRRAFGIDPNFRPTDALRAEALKRGGELPYTHALDSDLASEFGIVRVG